MYISCDTMKYMYLIEAVFFIKVKLKVLLMYTEMI